MSRKDCWKSKMSKTVNSGGSCLRLLRVKKARNLYPACTVYRCQMTVAWCMYTAAVLRNWWIQQLYAVCCEVGMRHSRQALWRVKRLPCFSANCSRINRYRKTWWTFRAATKSPASTLLLPSNRHNSAVSQIICIHATTICLTRTHKYFWRKERVCTSNITSVQESAHSKLASFDENSLRILICELEFL